ncbi:hypothetical protein C0J52_24948 [Blattella germanica]|nr:hypothetical protein C0J52_24948 [Blattella germanica]
MIHLHHQGMTLVAVALTGGTVNLYSGQQVMDTITAPDSVSGILFGRRAQPGACHNHNASHDLFRLRLNTARACVNALQSCSNPFSTDVLEPIKMSALVLGLGPTFKILITLSSTPSKDLAISFHCDDKLYIIEKPFIRVQLPTYLCCIRHL